MQAPRLKDELPAPARANGLLNASIPFAVACASGLAATVCIQPIDTLKVRMQLTDQSHGHGSSFSLARHIVARDGPASLYQGLSAGLLRQVVYGTLRLGLFTTFEGVLEQRAREKGSSVGFRDRALAGVTAGAMAAFLGNPTEVALIQMQADAIRPVHERRNYTSAVNTLWRIVKDDGTLALWKGVTPTIVRAMATNLGQLAFFSESKHRIQQYSSMSAEKRSALAAFIGGFAAAFISLPFDFIKTRLQNQVSQVSQVSRETKSALPVYRGVWHCFVTVVRTEGPLRFYRDFWPYFMRIAPHSTIALFLADRMHAYIRARI
ncbi:mitochondrial carrier domain-containing protein [Aspergillus unguis]